MKRFLCVLFAACAIAALGFAQELKLDGYINSGIGLIATNKDNDDTKIRVFGVDSEQAGGRFRLNGSYTNADKNVGANFRLQLQGNNSTSILGPSYVYGWVRPVEMLQIKAGIVDDSTWETGGAWLKDDQGEGAGLLFRLTPIEGLDLGVGVYAWSQSGSGGNNVTGAPGTIQKWDDIKYTFMASYTMPDVFKINVSGRTFNATGNGTSAQVIGELRLLVVKDLTAVIEFQMNNLYSTANKFDEFSKTGIFNLYETIAYSMDDLKFGLNAGQYFSNASQDKDASLAFSPWISYAMAEGKIVPRLDVGLFLGGHQNANNYDRRNEYKAASNATSTAIYNLKETTFSVRPSVKIFMDSRNFMEIGNAFYCNFVKDTDAVLTNIFYLDFVVRF